MVSAPTIILLGLKFKNNTVQVNFVYRTINTKSKPIEIVEYDFDVLTKGIEGN